MTDHDGTERELDREASDREVRHVLRAASGAPFGEVDWDRLHARIMADAAPSFRRAPSRAYDWVAAWSSGGIPITAATLAAALVVLWVAPSAPPVSEPEPVGLSLVAEELIAGLPEETRRLMSAGADVGEMLTAMATHREEDR